MSAKANIEIFAQPLPTRIQRGSGERTVSVRQYALIYIGNGIENASMRAGRRKIFLSVFRFGKRLQ